jgi:hypothetical protein
VRIVEGCEDNSFFFTRQRNVVGLIGIWHSSRLYLQNLHTGEDTTLECVHRFAKVIIRVFGPVYLRAHNEDDTEY